MKLLNPCGLGLVVTRSNNGFSQSDPLCDPLCVVITVLWSVGDVCEIPVVTTALRSVGDVCEIPFVITVLWSQILVLQPQGHRQNPTHKHYRSMDVWRVRSAEAGRFCDLLVGSLVAAVLVMISTGQHTP